MKKITLLLALFLSVTSISAYADSVKAIVENNESVTSNVQQNQGQRIFLVGNLSFKRIA